MWPCRAGAIGACGFSCSFCSSSPREHRSFLTVQPTCSLKLPFLSPQFFSQQGITGHLTVALCDTHRVPKTTESFHNFSKVGREIKKIIPSCVLKGSVSLGRDPISVRDGQLLLVSFFKYLSSPRKAWFVKNWHKLHKQDGNEFNTNAISYPLYPCTYTIPAKTKTLLRWGCPSIHHWEAPKKGKNSRKKSFPLHNHRIVALHLTGFKKRIQPCCALH